MADTIKGFYEIYSNHTTIKHKRNRHRKSQTQA